MLTDKQIDVITQWNAVALEPPWEFSTERILHPMRPNRRATLKRGEVAYKTYCESCHGPGGRGGPKGSAITDESFLALVSDQGLRTIVITGRPELGAPDWRENVPGKPMSEQEITDVVAWLASQRSKNSGQPYSVFELRTALGV